MEDLRFPIGGFQHVGEMTEELPTINPYEEAAAMGEILSPSRFGRSETCDELRNICAWHGKHHTAHITTLRERMGWS